MAATTLAAETLSELRDDLKAVMSALTKSRATKITSVSSGCELFLRFMCVNLQVGLPVFVVPEMFNPLTPPLTLSANKTNNTIAVANLSNLSAQHSQSY